jgi:hypothetical protein
VASLISSARWPRTLDRTNLFCSSWLISRVFAPFSRRTAVAVTLSCTGQVSRSEALVVRAPEINRESGAGGGPAT